MSAETRPATHEALRQRVPVDRLVGVGVFLLLVALVLLPVAALLYASVRTESPLQPGGEFTLDNYVRAYTDPLAPPTISNTVIFVLGTIGVATGLGSALAWIVVRTNTPGRHVFEFLTLVLFLTPSLLAVVAWTLLLSPTRGLVNRVIQVVFGFDRGPLDIFSLGGMIWVEGLYVTPLAFLVVAGALSNLDMSLEEAGRMAGSGVWGTFRRLTFPLIRPAVLSAVLLTGIIAIEAFEVPQLLGARERIFTFTSLIFSQIRFIFPPDYGTASALATSLLVVAIIGVYLYRRATAVATRYVTVHGKGYRAGVVDIGRWRWVTWAACVLFFAVTVFAPFAILLIGSLLTFYGRFDLDVFSRMTLSNYGDLLAISAVGDAIRNSLVLAVVSAMIAVLLASSVAFIAMRTRIRGRWLIEVLAMLPLGYPATVLALGLLWSYIILPLPIYGTFLILGIAYVTRYIPIGLRGISGGMIQIHSELEEVSRTSGASISYGFRRIVLPLLLPSLLAGWLMLFMIMVRELSMSVLLAGPTTPVIAVVLFDLYRNGEFGLLSAFSVVMTIGILAVVFVAQRLLRTAVGSGDVV